MGKTKKLLAASLAVTMLAGVTPILATDEGNAANQPVVLAATADAVITKKFSMPTQVTVPNVAFTFNIVKSAQDDREDFTYPDVPSKTITYGGESNGTATADGNITTYTQTEALFDDVKWTHAGEYTFTVTEVVPKNAVNNVVTDGPTTSADKKTVVTETTTYDSVSTRTVKAFVTNTASGLELSNVWVLDAAGDKETSTTSGNFDLTYNNSYTKDVEYVQNPDNPDPANSAFLLTKTVNGGLGDKTRQFEFTVANGDDNKVVAKIKRKGQTKAEDSVATGKISLADGDQYYITNAEIGTPISVNETDAAAGYEKSVVTTGSDNTKNATNSGSTGHITESGSTTAVTNTHTTTPDAGKMINNFPFLGMIAVALGGFVAFIAAKRRQAEEN